MTETPSTELVPATEMAPPVHRVRITSDGTLSGAHVEIDGRSVGHHVTAVDWHQDVKGYATARITFVGVEIDGIAEGVATIGDHPTATEHADPAPIHEQLIAFGQQLQAFLIHIATACATCLAEERGGTRQGHNIVNAIVDGTGYCNEHLDVVNGRLRPKGSSGLIVAGG